MKIYLSIIGTISFALTLVLALNKIELGALALALISAGSFLGAALTKEIEPISGRDSALLFELANHDGEVISISELNEKMVKRYHSWDLSSPDLQPILLAAQQARLIEISEGIIKIIR